MNICVICSGNICRSPFVEYILRRELDVGHGIYSAGTLNINGAPAYGECALLAPHYHIDLQSHRSRGINVQIIRDTDLFLVMTEKHRGIVRKEYRIAPEKITLLSIFLPEHRSFDLGFFGRISRGDDIPDPMGAPLPW